MVKLRVLFGLVLWAVFSGTPSYAYDLTHEDSVELELIDKLHPSTSRHLHLYIYDLQQELQKTEAELKAAKVKKPDYTWIWISLLVAVSIIGTVYVLLERRNRKKAIHKFQAIADKAQTTLEEREKFLAYTNHEIRTPLNAVSGSAELLTKTELSGDQEKYVKTIKASVDNVLVLVNDVLDLSRIESGNIEFHNADFLLSDVVTGIGYILQEKVDKKGIQFLTELDERIPTIVKGDSRYLNQILINLCNNAVKFTDLGKVTLKVHMVSETDNEIRLRFDVIDTGKGIRKSKLPTIFNQFEQETRHTIKTKGGSGLGLAITKQLVEAQGGLIEVESKYLEGTTFSVELNFGRSNRKQLSAKGADPSVLTEMRLLIVDDNQLNREILQDLLISLNSQVKVKCVVSGQEAIDELSEQDYDVVLMDIQMPEMNGYDTTQFIRKNVRAPMNEVWVIAMTAYAMENVAERCFEAGMNDFITKPVDSNFLLTKIERVQQKRAPLNAEKLKMDYVDLGNLKRLTGGDNNKMYKYIDLFLRNVPEDLDKLKSETKQENWDAALDVLHKIKGNTTYMGNKDVGQIYDDLSAGRRTDFGPALELAATQTQKCIDEIADVRKNFKLLFLEIK